MRKIFGKSARISGILAVALLLAGCGNQQKTVSDNITTEIATEAATEAPDTTSPVIELASDGVAYYEGDKYDPMEYVISVTDDSCETIKAEYDDKDVNIASPGDYVISYSATDSAGNSSEKKLNFKVKKEYTRDEIKEIIYNLIEDKYYIFDLEDETEIEADDYPENAIYGTLNVYENLENNVTNVPKTGYWGADTNVYTTVTLKIHVNTENYGKKNLNTNTLNSELVLNIYDESGATKVCNAKTVEISSDAGKVKLSSIINGTCVYNEDGYFRFARTHFCFDFEAQIEKFEEILKSTNVNIKITRENGEIVSFIMDKLQCDNWLKAISFYKEINEYVNNISVNE